MEIATERIGAASKLDKYSSENEDYHQCKISGVIVCALQSVG